MNGVTTMTVPPPLLTMKSQVTREASQTVSIRTISPPNSSSSSSNTNLGTQSEAVGATVFVGASAPVVDSMPTTCRTTRIPEVQTSNGHGQHQKNNNNFIQQRPQQASHVVKIKIDPDGEKKGMVISTVRLTLNDNENSNRQKVITNGDNKIDGAVLSDDKSSVNERRCVTGVRISVYGNDHDIKMKNNHCENGEMMVQRINDSDHQNNNNNNNNNNNDQEDNNRMNHKNGNDSTRTCFYYHNYQTPLLIPSGQCSPSETLDSGTCSDLDGTPPPLPKKKSINKRNNSTVILSGLDMGDLKVDAANGSTSSGPEVDDSDDNESNLSGDSLNGINVEDTLTGTLRKHNGNPDDSIRQSNSASASAVMLTADTSFLKINDLSRKAKVVVEPSEDEPSVKFQPIQLTNGNNNNNNNNNEITDESYVSKTTLTPRIRRPEPDAKLLSSTTLLVQECTYEERKQEQKRIDEETSRLNEFVDLEKNTASDKYVYDRFLKFHLNGLKVDNKDDTLNKNDELANKGEIDESFAGCKLLEKEAIRSAKGTVRGVKNRVRAGIATFLQKTSIKTYKEEAGKLVVYTTSLGVVRETYYRCIKVKQILRTNMARFDEKDLLYRSELKTELRDRIGDASMHLPQIFVDGQYLGDGERIEELNESGQLREILQPYITDYRQLGQCNKCGDYRMLLCTTCNGSKRSHYRNEFTKEIVALRCMKCNEAGLILCDSC